MLKQPLWLGDPPWPSMTHKTPAHIHQETQYHQHLCCDHERYSPQSLNGCHQQWHSHKPRSRWWWCLAVHWIQTSGHLTDFGQKVLCTNLLLGESSKYTKYTLNGTDPLGTSHPYASSAGWSSKSCAAQGMSLGWKLCDFGPFQHPWNMREMEVSLKSLGVSPNHPF